MFSFRSRTVAHSVCDFVVLDFTAISWRTTLLGMPEKNANSRAIHSAWLYPRVRRCFFEVGTGMIIQAAASNWCVENVREKYSAINFPITVAAYFLFLYFNAWISDCATGVLNPVPAPRI
jgi:hypothetical protein